MANEFRVRKGLIVNGSGSVILDIQGSQGQLFSVTDQLSGSLFSVNDISGMPILQVGSDDSVKLGTYAAEAIKVSGSIANITGSLFGTSSFAISASNAATASSADNFTVRGTLTAQTIVVQTITSSVSFMTGSTRFGSLLTDTHTFTGSVNITGSLTVTGSSNLGGATFSGGSGTFTNDTSVIRNAGTSTFNVGDGSTSNNGTIRIIKNATSNSANLFFRSGSTDVTRLWLNASNNFEIANQIGSSIFATFFTNTTNVGINTSTDAGYRLDVNGTARVQSGLTVTGSLITTGSNTLIGNTSLTGSLNISGSEVITGYMQLMPVSTNIDNSVSASYVYVSGSTNDLYFTQNGSGYSNTTRLRWIESNLYTGLLSGGVLSSTPGSTTFNLSSGSGIIVQLNASTGSSDPYPTVQKVTWGNYTNQPIINSGSAKLTYISVTSTGAINQQIVPIGSTDVTQWDTQIELGVILHLSGSVSSGAYNSPQVSYGFAQRTDDFVRAFGPLKISGHVLQPSGSTLGLIKTAGTAYNNGANYTVNPNHPSTVSDPAVTVSKIYRYYVSGSTPIIDLDGPSGYSFIDPSQYVDTTTGTLASVPSGQYSIQRVFWVPNSPTNAFIVYYGNAKYNSADTAVAAIQTEQFTEAPNTAQNAILLGYIIVQGGETNLQNATFIQGGLFRSVNGIGNSNATPVSNTLAGLSDVSVASRTTGDLLYYNGSQWVNAKSLIGAYNITGSLNVVTAGVTADGSSRFGNSTANTQTLTGSVNITGSLNLSGSASVTGQINIGTNPANAYLNGSSGNNRLTIGGFTQMVNPLYARNELGFATNADFTPDAGFSRLGASRISVTNGTNGDFSGTLVATKVLLNTTTDAGYNLYISGSSTSGSSNIDNTLYVSGSRVGIGTSIPSTPLEIVTTGTNAASINLNAQGTGNASIRHYRGNAFKFEVGPGGGSNDYLIYNSGIANYSFRIKNDTTGNISLAETTGSILIGTSTDIGYKVLVTGSGASGSLNVNNALYVTGSSVGIGTSVPSSSLDVYSGGISKLSVGNAVVIGRYNVVSSTATQLVFGEYASTGTPRPQFIFNGVANWTGLGQAYSTGTTLQKNTLRLGAVGGTGSAWSGLGTTAFALGIDGQLGIGTVDPVSKLHISGSPDPSGSYGTISIGGGGFNTGSFTGSFTGSNAGTSIAVNELGTFGGNLIDLQVSGSSKFNINNLGNLYAAGNNIYFGGISTTPFLQANFGGTGRLLFNTANGASTVQTIYLDPSNNKISLNSSFCLGFTTNIASISPDVGITRLSAGVLGISNGSAGNSTGTLALSNLIVSSSLLVSGSASITGSLAVSGSLSVNGTITATTLVVQTITASTEYSSGSNIFGNSTANTQVFTGSVSMTGSLYTYGKVTHDGIISGSQPANNPSSSLVLISGSILPNSGSTTGGSAVLINTVLSASANNQALIGLEILPTYNTGSSTGVLKYGLKVEGIYFGQITSPSNYNIAIGSNNSNGNGFTLQNLTTGVRNIAIGGYAGGQITYGTDNTIVGYNAGAQRTYAGSGSANVIVGNNAAFYGQASNTVIIGYNAINNGNVSDGVIAIGANTTLGGGVGVAQNNIIIGNSASTSTISGGNQIVIGASAVGLGANTTVIGNSSTATTAIFGNLLLGTTTGSIYKLDVSGSARIQAGLTVTGTITGSSALISGSGTQRLVVIGSGSAQPIFTVQGSQGELFSVTDSLSGSLFSVNDVSGLPILEVFSDSTTLVGSYLAPALNTTTKITTTNSGSFVIYSVPTASYDGIFVDYTARSGSNARAGVFTAIWSGSSVNYMDNSTTDFGNTTALSLVASISGSNMVVTGSVTAGSGWTVKAIIRSI